MWVTDESAEIYSCFTHALNIAVVTLNFVDRKWKFHWHIPQVYITAGGIPEAMLEEEMKSYTYSSHVKNAIVPLRLILLLVIDQL